MRRWLLMALVVGICAGPSVAWADDPGTLGIGVTKDPLTVGHNVPRGNSARLTSLYVVNTGTATERISLAITYLTKAGRIAMPSSWLHTGVSQLQLAAGAHQWIAVTVDVPRSAVDGDYATNIIATVQPLTQNASGPSVSGAAAATAYVSVGGGPWLSITHTGYVALGLIMLAFVWWVTVAVRRLINRDPPQGGGVATHRVPADVP